ncbi:MAG: glycosyltransferase [Bacilli bacterium]|nr:glycosyltransferase [Bacilli bacterium]
MNPNKIIFLTTAIDEKSFDFYKDAFESLPNPANQNFGLRFINSLLTLNKPVEVISLYSLKHKNKKISDTSIQNCSFSYVKRCNNFLSTSKVLINLISKNNKKEEVVVIYDSLNLALSRAADKLSKKGYKTVSILTDNPKNISFVSSTYIRLTYKYNKNASAYYALTNKLNSLFNKKERPFIICEAIADTIKKSANPHQKPYIYFAGALFERYGLLDLINAFLSVKPDYDLIIAGHGPLDSYIKELSLKLQNIIFLGQISREKNLQYEQHAFLNINPRLFNPALDEYSVPSKVIEYLSSPGYVASTLSTPVFKIFKGSLNLIENCESFFKEHLDDSKQFKNLVPNKAIEEVKERYSFDAVGRKINSIIIKL